MTIFRAVLQWRGVPWLGAAGSRLLARGLTYGEAPAWGKPALALRFLRAGGVVLRLPCGCEPSPRVAGLMSVTCALHEVRLFRVCRAEVWGARQPWHCKMSLPGSGNS